MGRDGRVVDVNKSWWSDDALSGVELQLVVLVAAPEAAHLLQVNLLGYTRHPSLALLQLPGMKPNQKSTHLKQQIGTTDFLTQFRATLCETEFANKWNLHLWYELPYRDNGLLYSNNFNGASVTPLVDRHGRRIQNKSIQ